MVYSHRIIIIYPFNYSSLSPSGMTANDRRRLPGPKPTLWSTVNQSNKPVWVHGLPAPAARIPLDRTAHLVCMLITLRAFPLDYLSGKFHTPVLLSHKLSIYTSDLRVVSSTLRTCPYHRTTQYLLMTNTLK